MLGFVHVWAAFSELAGGLCRKRLRCSVALHHLNGGLAGEADVTDEQHERAERKNRENAKTAAPQLAAIPEIKSQQHQGEQQNKCEGARRNLHGSLPEFFRGRIGQTT